MRSSEWFVVPFFTAALVLAWSGAAKLRRPGQLVRALGTAGLPARPGAVRLIASAELGLGTLGLIRPTAAVAAAVGLAYLGFAGFLSFLLVAKPAIATCGCAGDRQVPPSWLHVALDAIAVASAFGFAAMSGGSDGIVGIAAPLPLSGVTFLVGVGLLGYLASLCAAYLPQAMSSYHGQR
jgi:hypothetical protein